MRASTLFALTVAVLLGLATAVTLKVTGFFDKPSTPVAASAAKTPDVIVLVSGRNLFKGNLIDAPWVGTRVLRADELKHYEAHKDEYLPPSPGIVTFRVAAKNIEADRPLLRSDLEDLSQPTNLSSRLLPSMRAVNVAVNKDESAGGLIQEGEWVDVLLTTSVQGSDGSAVTKTAGIAHRLRVIAKRNALWQFLGPLPDDKPVNYTLEANPYRAQVIEFCKTKGTLSLVPVSAVDQKVLEDEHKAALADMDQGIEPVGYKAPFPTNSMEYADEDARIEGTLKGEVNVGNGDLARMFSIRTTAPPLANVTIDVVSGAKRVDSAVFNAAGDPIDTGHNHAIQAPAARPAILDYQFVPVDTPVKKCPTCGKHNPK